MTSTRSRSKKSGEECSESPPKKLKAEKQHLFEENKRFAKNSFNRFGDDLCEVLLSYLPIEDKFKYECVSRQWQRLVFNKQYKVVLDFYVESDRNTILTPKNKNSYKQLFTHLFRKLKNLRDIECHHYFSSATVEVIINNCRYIERFGFNGYMNKDLFNQFFAKFGKRLICVDLSCVYNKQFDNIFENTPNLKELKLNKQMNHLVETFLSKLVGITFPINISSESLTSFTEKYFKQIKTICIRFDHNSTTEEVNKCLNQISKYENLESLTLKLRMLSKKSFHLDSGLKQIGIKCKTLKSFTLKSSHCITNESLLSVLNKYQSLVRLKVYVESSTHQDLGSVAQLNSSQLKHLTLEFNGITDETFNEIHIFLPNLKTYHSNDCINNQLTDQTLNYFSKSQTLRSLTLIGKYLTESGALTLINNCPQITCIDIYYDCTVKSIHAMTTLAAKHPKRRYKLYVNSWPNKPLLKFNRKKLPINLNIIQF